MKNIEELQKLLPDLVKSKELEKIFSVIGETAFHGRTIFTAGNGGSAATASHMACDLMKNTVWRPPVVCLTDSAPVLTAYSNDGSYESALGDYLRALSRPFDILLVMSVSGNSPNIINVIKEANRYSLTTIGLFGFNGGQARQFCNYSYVVRSENYGVVEDMHSIIMHTLVEYLK